MPLSLRRGTVTAAGEADGGLVRLEVDGEPCVAFPGLTGPVEVGDEVLVNEQARALALGSGGFDVLYANLTRGLGLGAEPGAHVMKLPYSPLQLAARHVEEAAAQAETLDGVPVVCCTLHSQLAAVCGGIGEGLRVAWVQLPGGALPVALSDAVRELERRGLLATTVSVGACFGGEHEAVTVASALAALAESVDVFVCGIGPGIVGTASRYGHGAVAAAEAANAAAALRGSPILVPRISMTDERQRHQGVSHHTRAALELSLGTVTVAWPAGLEPPAWLEQPEEIDVEGWQEACADLPLSTMGRGPDEEPWFFAAAFAAGRLARRLAG